MITPGDMPSNDRPPGDAEKADPRKALGGAAVAPGEGGGGPLSHPHGASGGGWWREGIEVQNGPLRGFARILRNEMHDLIACSGPRTWC